MKKSRRSDISVLYKVIIPVTSIFIVVYVSFLLYLNYGIIHNDIEERLKNAFEKTATGFTSKVNDYTEKFSVTAAALANNPIIQQSIESYYIDSLANLASREVSKSLNWIDLTKNKDVRIHIHRYDGISYYRSWSQINGDELKHIPSISRVYKEQKKISGIEIRNDGPVIFCIQPIFNHDNIMLGSVDVFVYMKDLLNELNDTLSNVYSLLILKDKWTKTNSTQLITGVINFKDFVSFDDYFNSVITDNLQNTNLTSATKNPVSFLTDGLAYNLVPVSSFNDQEIGVLVNQHDLSKIIDFYRMIKLKAGIVLLLIIIVSLFILIITFKKVILIPLHQIYKSLNALAKGEHNRRIKIKSQDEIGKIKRAINHVNESLINVEYFAHEIGEGELNATFKPRSKKDTLAHTLTDMQKKLKNSREDANKRRETEKILEWKRSGITEINKILRAYSNNTSELFYHIIGNLVKYINANQGGIFILDEDAEYLELKGCYAYDRNKFLEKKVHVKEGLIGRCYQEKETINLSNIPDSYMKIVSAVGEKSPEHLLLVPLLHDEKVKGVFELASFTKFEQHIVEFIQEVCQPVSMALNDIDYSDRTRKLLEESKEKEQKLIQQEEEMRQNMEELKATQEQLERKQFQIADIAKELIREENDMRKFLERIKNL